MERICSINGNDYFTTFSLYQPYLTVNMLALPVAPSLKGREQIVHEGHLLEKSGPEYRSPKDGGTVLSIDWRCTQPGYSGQAAKLCPFRLTTGPLLDGRQDGGG